MGCVILAGGKSSRMGSDKALLEYQGETFLSHLQQVMNDFDEKLLSRNLNSNESSWVQISDIHQEIGPMGGLHSALYCCQNDMIFVSACDTPYLTQKLIHKIIHEYDDEDVLLVQTSDERLHPLCGIYHKRIFSSLEKAIHQKNYRLMRWIETLNYKVIQLDEEESKQLMNFNTPQDYQYLKR